MVNSGFEKIQHSDNCLFGPRKLLLCGFTAEDQPIFKALLEMLGMNELPVVWISQDQASESIKDLAELPDGWGASRSSTLPRAIIVSGISENELHELMTGCRRAGMKRAIWAALTPTSISWRLQQLLTELSAEHQALNAKRAAGTKPPPIEGD